jgi:hypothetical protein
MDPIPPALAAIVAGAGLLAMAIIAALANFGALENLIVRGNAAANAENLIRSADLFRLGAFGLITVAILDILVAWGLYIVFRGINRDLSLLAACFSFPSCTCLPRCPRRRRTRRRHST